MKPDDLSKEKATIQLSEAPTYNGGCDSITDDYQLQQSSQLKHNRDAPSYDA